MSARFMTTNIWDELTEAARRSKKPAHIAVAYFGKGASKSRLVVDASEATVKAGLTHPKDLRRMQLRKNAIYSSHNLHAKVFAFDEAVFIGSANASKNATKVLQEAMVRVTDAAVKRAARSFINDLCLEPLGPKELKLLQSMYRSPRFVPGQSKKSGSKQRYSALRVWSYRGG
jgi:phosphatidylserine/phosphatidylglycerophosphate/cardiolipin synthase-like enzyme